MVLADLGPRLTGSKRSGPDLEREVKSSLDRTLQREDVRISPVERSKFVTEVLSDILGYGPLDGPLADPTVTEIMCNAYDQIWVERRGVIEPTDYAFTDEAAPIGFVPKLYFHRITAEPFEVLGETVTPIPLHHSVFNVFGFRVGDMAYCTDVSEIPDASWRLLEGVRYLVIDCLRYKSHPAHFGLNDALDVIERLNPERAFLTHMSHELDYEVLPASLPGGVEMGYDGLRFRF
jgi:ribonuclease BN (tRNA processing enzyme)